MKAYELHPVDTLFFRDARPMQSGAGSGGHGANWPLPTTLHEALRANLLRQEGCGMEGRKTHVKTRKKNGKEYQTEQKKVVTDLFRSLHTVGPFPAKDGALYLPCPADVVADDKGAATLLHPFLKPPGFSNMPESWLRPLISDVRSGKNGRPHWVPIEFFRKCLKGEPDGMPSKTELFDTEHRIGIELDDATSTAEEGKFFTSEHLRLRPGVCLWFKAGLSDRDAKNNRSDVTLDALLNQLLTFGGESRMCRLRKGEELLPKEAIPEPSGKLIKWALITPAVFRCGWRPNWVDEKTGSVLLRKGGTTRGKTADGKTEDRLEWRERVRNMPAINAHLVAVCMQKPIHFSGWDLSWETTDKNGAKKTGGPKPTMLAVPAGTVYYFETTTPEDGKELVKALHGRTQSDFFGEKGMGMGYCGTWKPFEN